MEDMNETVDGVAILTDNGSPGSSVESEELGED
jgi:hypothetical protein